MSLPLHVNTECIPHHEKVDAAHAQVEFIRKQRLGFNNNFEGY